LLNAEIMNYPFLLLLLLLLLVSVGESFGKIPVKKGNPELVSKIKSTSGLVAFWDFKEDAGKPRKAFGEGKFPLKEQKGQIPRVSEGPISGFSALFKDSAFLSLPNHKTGKLNIYGKNQGVTVMAWVKWEGKTGFVGGMWNEYASGGKRQYGLFVSLPHYNGGDQVCGHISYTGKPTPPFPYSIDYSASKQTLEKSQWEFVAFTYDGEFIRSYLNGELKVREPELLKNTKGFPGYPEGITHSKNPYFYPDGMGNNGSDFTVGAVLLARGMGNYFRGQIGGLAVFNRALSPEEITGLNYVRSYL
jgi:hypothetical protein